MAADVRQAMEAAIERRQDLKAVAGRRMAADAGVSAAQGGWWPQIELTASYAYNSPNQRYQPVIAEFLGSWDVGVSMYLELWNWGATAHRVELAEAQLRQAELQESQLRETITLEVNRAVLTLQRSREKISVATTGVQQAEEQLRTVTDKFRTGLATSTDLLDAEVALLQAQTQFTAAQIEYAISRASLTRALGGAGQL
jgi:outer membrane protein TolC